ncbi:MAG: DUF1572 family protein [Parafilimonas sp.]|nr:DUF1572 family protein [Parafilimonas sp.]
MKTGEAFLQCAIKRFKLQKQLAEKAFDQLNDADFLFKPSKESNSIAVIVQHMSGNMLSRWTNFLTEDGEKVWRERDKEFEDMQTTKQDVLSAWSKGWQCVFNALEILKDKDVMNMITIRGERMTVIDAVIRQIEHYGYHVGQIVYIGRIIKDEDWNSLSIPKNKSAEFNQQMNKS